MLSRTKSPSRPTTPQQPADAVDTQLARYRAMRNFNITSEPSGGAASKKPSKTTRGLPFVIQKHAASHLHYDFRMGWHGVLKSWACAKGPSYVPGDRRLAVQVEDHPMEYGGFEGIIPQGQYGGGTVMVWDEGTWWPQPGHENIDAGLREGSLKFEMNGTKMKGKWTLVRMNGKAANEAKPNWLLIKEHDAYERDATGKSITEEKPNSAITKRSLEDIAAQQDHVWNSKDTAKPGKAWRRNEVSSKHHAATPDIDIPVKQLPKEAQPAFLKPQLAQEAAEPPAGDGWLYELKLDGYRIQARKSGTKVQLLTRSGLDWAHRMPEVAAAVAKLSPNTLTLDGEVVVLSADGTSSFADLQASFQQGASHPLTYFCFDLLHINGRNPRAQPLQKRKELLNKILPEGEILRLSEHMETSGVAMFQHACELHAEGILCKRAESAYQGGRSTDWLKLKCLHEQEFVVGGYTLSSDGADRVGSLLLGYYDGTTLVYAGRTGTGFTQQLRRDLLQKLGAGKTSKPAFKTVPTAARKGALWVKPKLVAQVRFATWTAENLVRQAAFLGLREDKAAEEVRREEAISPPQPKRHRVASVSSERQLAKVHPKSSSHASKLRLTHPDKVLDPEPRLTKRQLADFYAAVANRMLPHIANRPLSLVRCPEGAGKPCFFQKHVNAMLPPGIGSVDVPDKKTGKPEAYITIDNAEAIAGLAQMGVLEIHPWGSSNGDLEHPDRLIFDLDPDESISWPTLCESAAEVRSRLRSAGLTSFLKLTGGKGLHIVAPIAPTLTWDELKSTAYNFVSSMERGNPSLYLTKMSKAARKGKIYLDYLRNERGATAVAPYSPRARLGTNVSLPLPWTALKERTRPVFSVHDFANWKHKLASDPWKALLTTEQELKAKEFAQANLKRR